jgi:hypothetical protein
MKKQEFVSADDILIDLISNGTNILFLGWNYKNMLIRILPAIRVYGQKLGG